VDSNEIFFVASGITDGPLLDGVRYRRGIAETHSLVLNRESGTWRMVRAEHRIE
jgi:fructose-1,6-bisphosphatase II